MDQFANTVILAAETPDYLERGDHLSWTPHVMMEMENMKARRERTHTERGRVVLR